MTFSRFGCRFSALELFFGNSACWLVLLLAAFLLSGKLQAETLKVPPLIDAGDMATASAGPRTPPVSLIYNPARAAELTIFNGSALRFIQSARPLRRKINTMNAREQVNFLERYVFAMCNSRLVNGMDLVYKLDTGSENFCGYVPGMLSCYVAENCDEKTGLKAVQYMQGALDKFDRFMRWTDQRKWQYRGDALKVGFYTRNTLTRSGRLCATLKLINDNEQAVVVYVRASLKTPDGRAHGVFSRPYYVAAHSSLPNLSDEDLFNRDTEARMRKLTLDAQELARRQGITDIQAYTGTQEHWNCVAAATGRIAPIELQKIHIDFTN